MRIGCSKATQPILIYVVKQNALLQRHAYHLEHGLMHTNREVLGGQKKLRKEVMSRRKTATALPSKNLFKKGGVPHTINPLCSTVLPPYAWHKAKIKEDIRQGRHATQNNFCIWDL